MNFSRLSPNSLQLVGDSLLPFMRKALCGIKPDCPLCRTVILHSHSLPTMHSGYLLTFSFAISPDIIHVCFTELSGVCAAQLSANCLCLSSSAMALDSVHSGKICSAIPQCQRVDRPLGVYEHWGWMKARLVNSSFASICI